MPGREWNSLCRLPQYVEVTSSEVAEMDRDQLKFALVQVLENYRRCGVTRLEREPADALAAAVVDRLRAVATPPPMAAARTLHQTGTPASERSGARPASASAGAVSPAYSSAGPPTGVYQSPISQYSAPDPAEPLVADDASTVAPRLSAGGATWELPVLALDDRHVRFSELRQQVAACRQCADIVSYRQQTVFGSGPLNPTVCFMGEAPGADEDRTGEPFVGKAGQLLSKIIAAMQLQREEVYILNALKCRPPQNRTPVPDEITHCRNFVATQLNVLQPKYIVCLGSVAVQSLLQSTLPIGRLRGRFHDYRGAQVVVTYHPSYLLRNESAKRLVWEDMQMLMREMGLLPR